MNNTTTQEQAEETMRSTAESVGALAERIQETVRQTQAKLTELQRELVDKTKNAAQSTDAYVHEKPWTAVCTAITVGFVIGVIIGRK